MKQLLKFKKTAKGVALTLLQPAYDIVEDIPVPGAKAGIGALLDLIKGIDVSIAQLSFLDIILSHDSYALLEDFPECFDHRRARKTYSTPNRTFGASEGDRRAQSLIWP